MGDLGALLRSCSYHAERLLKKRGYLCGVIWLTEARTGYREMFETQVDDGAPADASNTALLAKLIAEMREDFISTGVTSFACAYSAKRVTTLRTTKAGFATDIIGIEAHDIEGGHWRAECDLIEFKPGRPILGAHSVIEPAADSIYAGILGSAVHLQAAS